MPSRIERRKRHAIRAQQVANHGAVGPLATFQPRMFFPGSVPQVAEAARHAIVFGDLPATLR